MSRLKRGHYWIWSRVPAEILGVVSIAALPRRLSLDFSDVFDDGLAFDTLKGDFTIDDGNAYTCNLGLEGSVADLGRGSGEPDSRTRTTTNLR